MWLNIPQLKLDNIQVVFSNFEEVLHYHIKVTPNLRRATLANFLFQEN